MASNPLCALLWLRGNTGLLVKKSHSFKLIWFYCVLFFVLIFFSVMWFLVLHMLYCHDEGAEMLLNEAVLMFTSYMFTGFPLRLQTVWFVTATHVCILILPTYCVVGFALTIHVNCWKVKSIILLILVTVFPLSFTSKVVLPLCCY